MYSSEAELRRHSSTNLSTFAFMILIAFVVHVSLVPYDFSTMTGDSRFGGLPGYRHPGNSLPDIVSNLFLYIPVGFALSFHLLRRRASRMTAFFATVIVLTPISYLLEFAQAFTQSRVSSRSDFVSNVIGAAAGAMIACACSGLVRILRERFVAELRERPRMVAAKAYVLILVVVATLPFSFSFDVGGLKKAAKQAVWTPFGALKSDVSQSQTLVESHEFRNPRLSNVVHWENQAHWLRWTVESVSFILLVWLLHPALRREYFLGTFTAHALTLWFVGATAIFLSILQAFVLTRGFDSTDILFRAFGMLVGCATVRWMNRSLRSSFVQAANGTRNWSARLLASAAVGYIVIAALLPLRFDVSLARVWQSLTSIAFWPFFTSFESRFDVLMLDIMSKAASYVVFGAAASLLWRQDDDRPLHCSHTLRAAVLISATTEAIQMFLPDRVPGLTDLVLAVGGSFVGIRVRIALTQFLRSLDVDSVALAEDRLGQDERSVYLSPVDELIATLYEPSSTAPREPTLPVMPRQVSSSNK